MNLTIAAIALAVAGALGGWAGHELTAAHYEKQIAASDEKNRKDLVDANLRAENAASDYEVWKSIQKPKTITVTREIERAIKADSDCSAKPLPLSLRNALIKAGGGSDQPVPSFALSASSPAGAVDVGGHSFGIFGRSGGARGLLGETPVTR